MDRTTFGKLVKFCPAYEKHCALSKLSDGLALPDLGSNLVVPPPLPKGGDFAALDLPIGSQTKSSLTVSAVSKTRLTAAIIASCTPDCTAAHCTDECKCAHTHPKVHAMCNPPSNAQLADTCQKWYAKCPMFQPVQYY
uniref:CFEM domain-containing protein n=1 Tax=Heterorhabditis bacteriophora TaxID=37862 RepID=A0A1I7XW92_HETBA